VGFGAQDESPQVDDIPELKRVFRPELLNRLDEQILFRALEKEDIKQILTPILGGICQRLKDQHNIMLKIDKKVKVLLAENGYDPEFGARELRRTVERLLEAKLADKLLEHEKMTSTVCWRVTCMNDIIVIKVRNSQRKKLPE
jgi:ATP-dependent Clp protease ATP-binding subunit ClpC